MDRRNFLQRSGLGVFGLMGFDRLASLRAKDMSAAQNITITKVETVRFKNAHWIWVRLHTNTGIIGTGETYPLSPNSVDFKDMDWHNLAGRLLGSNPLEIEQTWEGIYRRNAFNVSGGSEIRALSAVNIALGHFGSGM